MDEQPVRVMKSRRMPADKDPESTPPGLLICAEGRLRLHPPPTWQWLEREYNVVVLQPALHNWVFLQAEVQTYEVPDDIASDDLSRYLYEPGIPDDADFCVLGLEERIFEFDTVSEEGDPLRVWRRQMIVGDYLRIAVFFLQVRPERKNSPEYRDILATAEEVVQSAQFSPEVLPADRIGPAERLKSTAAHDVIRMRVPEHWKRRSKNGRTVFDTDDPDGPTLWLDWKLVKKQDETMATGDVWAQIGDVTKAPKATDKIIYEQASGTDENDGQRLRIYSWHRLVERMGGVVLAHFNLVLLERDADSPENQALRELIEREVNNAVISYPNSGGMTAVTATRH